MKQDSELAAEIDEAANWQMVADCARRNLERPVRDFRVLQVDTETGVKQDSELAAEIDEAAIWQMVADCARRNLKRLQGISRGPADHADHALAVPAKRN